ncbi:MAG: hypothetical protein AAGA48_05010 [Myxococcota bacterium]
MLFFIATAAAQVTGHYHPEDIQMQSEMFAEASERLSGVFDQRSRDLRRFAIALNEYQEALDLLGDRASEVERTRLLELRRAYSKQESEVQFVADGVIEDFDTAMVAAMQRAIEPFGDAQRCKARLQKGPQLPGMPVKDEPNPECKGQNLNEAIAKAMDEDTTLAKVVDEVLERPWPAIAMPDEPQPVLGEGATEWILVRDLMTTAAKPSLSDITRRDDERRQVIDAALEEEGELDIDALRTEVRRIEQQTANARTALATPVIEMAEARLAKKVKEATIGWCANPRSFGGCAGTDATKARVSLLMEDRKFKKSLP